MFSSLPLVVPMKKTLLVVLALFFAGGLYLAFWPVPVDPVAWIAPPAPAYEGVFAPNTYLEAADVLALPDGHGPEDVAVDSLGRIWAGLQDGRIVRLSPDGRQMETVANTGGRPLGLDFDAAGRLIVADAYAGLLAVTPDGAITVLSTASDGVPFGFTDDVDVGPDGRIYFSDASSRHGQRHYKFDLIESRPHGRLLVYDPATGRTQTLLDGLHFANGVAVSPDTAFVLVNETSRYRVVRYALKGAAAGTASVVLDNLPGFPDGISAGATGLFWLALVSPRNALLDRLAPHPAVRKALLRLPTALQPAPERYAFVLGIDADGGIVHNLQSPTGRRFAIITSVEQVGNLLYLGSLEEPALARIAAP